MYKFNGSNIIGAVGTLLLCFLFCGVVWGLLAYAFCSVITYAANMSKDSQYYLYGKIDDVIQDIILWPAQLADFAKRILD